MARCKADEQRRSIAGKLRAISTESDSPPYDQLADLAYEALRAGAFPDKAVELLQSRREHRRRRPTPGPVCKPLHPIYQGKQYTEPPTVSWQLFWWQEVVGRLGLRPKVESLFDDWDWRNDIEALADAVEAAPATANRPGPTASSPNTSTGKTDQGEGKDETGSAPGQPTINSGADRETVLRKQEKAVRQAYQSYEYAESKVGKRIKDREAYELLHDEGIPTDKGDLGELTDYKLPSFDTWVRQLRTARTALGEQKYTRRAGRSTGSSIVRGDQIEYQRGDEK